MCGQEYVYILTYRHSEMSKNETKGLLNLADIFCLQLYVKIPLFKHFW